MNTKLWILVIEDRNGDKTATSYLSRAAARAALVERCRREWGKGSVPPSDPDMVILFYYCRVDDEFFDIHECETEVPVTQNAFLQQALDYQAAAFDADEEVNGADLVEWFSDWRGRVKEAMQV